MTHPGLRKSCRMPMKMPMGPDWFRSIRWNIPNALQSLIPGYEAFATTMMKKTIKNTGVAEIGELRSLGLGDWLRDALNPRLQ